ncbi:CerR family C-terminal domain-containing protein [Uliginosibacterium sp. H1]|uniref:CerR family C-terminal domain-containing protein n=1 Tax=Uliginosibacterium sp. H1 TaxID=3114757 RepID=UPI002E172E94|nr:CerR family C-terminal domain-containing protein [Uliginosibacterium sp. H1]
MSPAPGRPAGNNATGEETRAQLIAAATEVFIDEGYKSARVADIATRAQVRLSAINYHFGGKEGLYLAVLGHHAQLAIERTPIVSPQPGLSSRARLHFFVTALLTRLLGDGTGEGEAIRLPALMSREIMSPTAALDTMFERFIKPQSAQLDALVRDIAGADLTQDQVRRAMLSVFGQCMTYRLARPMVERLDPSLYGRGDLVAHLADHISAFSWAGLQAMREGRESQA